MALRAAFQNQPRAQRHSLNHSTLNSQHSTSLKHSTLQSPLSTLLAAILCWSGLAAAAEKPDAHAILSTVRAAQTSQHQVLRGHLRNGGTKIPFRLIASGNTLRWEFTDPPQTLQLRLLDRDSRLEEITDAGAKKVTSAKFDAKVRGTDISYEDLAFKFLYWPDASVEGEDVIALTSCWRLLCVPPSKSDSQYSKVRVWIAKETGALMKAEAYGHDGRLVRSFTVRSGQKIEGAWMLKQMRIEQPDSGRAGDRQPTYLEVDGVEKS